MTKGFWKHERFMDVYVWVLKVRYSGATYLKVLVEWWVRGKNLGLRKETIKIMREDLKFWRRV